MCPFELFFILLRQHLLQKKMFYYCIFFLLDLIVILISIRKRLYVRIVVLLDEGNYNESFFFMDKYVNRMVESNTV